MRWCGREGERRGDGGGGDGKRAAVYDRDGTPAREGRKLCMLGSGGGCVCYGGEEVVCARDGGSFCCC